MTAEKLLQHLSRVKRRGPDKWQACCPAHDDHTPSLAIRELDDGRILLHCFAGCGAAEVLDAIGMTFSDLYPPRVGGQHLQKIRRPFNSSDVLAGVAFEILIAWLLTKQLANDHQLSEKEQDRLLVCATRLQRGMEVAGV